LIHFLDLNLKNFIIFFPLLK